MHLYFYYYATNLGIIITLTICSVEFPAIGIAAQVSVRMHSLQYESPGMRYGLGGTVATIDRVRFAGVQEQLISLVKR